MRNRVLVGILIEYEEKDNFRSWVVIWPEDGPDKEPKHVANLTSKKRCVLTEYLRVSFC